MTPDPLRTYPVTAVVHGLDAVFWSIMDRPTSSWTDEDRRYLEKREAEYEDSAASNPLLGMIGK